MFRHTSPFCLLLAILGVTLLEPTARGDYAMILPSSYQTGLLWPTSLVDPIGVVHSRQEACDKVIVAIFSAPNISQGSEQKTWSKILASNFDAKLNQVALYLVEDMPEAGIFQAIARYRMKGEFIPNCRPLPVVDDTSKISRGVGVPVDKTVILVYDKNYMLRDVESHLDEVNLTVARLKAITTKLSTK